MTKNLKLKKGFTINLAGKAELKTTEKPSRTYAIMMRMDYETMNTKENGTLTQVENIGDTASYALTFSAYY